MTYDSIRDELSCGLDKTAEVTVADINKVHKDKYESRLSKAKIVLPASIAMLIGAVAFARYNLFTEYETLIFKLSLIFLGVSAVSSLMVFWYNDRFCSFYPSLANSFESIKNNFDNIFKNDADKIAEMFMDNVKKTITPISITMAKTDNRSNLSNIFQTIFFIASIVSLILLIIIQI
jgi:hypothetical protein